MADFPKAVAKHFPYPAWGDEMSGRPEQELRDVIVGSRNNIDRVKIAMAENPKITALEEDLKNIKGPFNDAIKAQDAKVKACLQILRERGRLSDEARQPTEKDEDEDGAVETADSTEDVLEELDAGDGF